MATIRRAETTHISLRMVVAMFLTKDLMIDWRLGEMVGHLNYPRLFCSLFRLYLSTSLTFSLTMILHLTMAAGYVCRYISLSKNTNFLSAMERIDWC